MTVTFRAAAEPATSRRDYWQDVVGNAMGPVDLQISGAVGERDRLVVADAHFISVRHLHKLFEGHESTVAGWIRVRRLDRCRRDLLDPALRDRTVGAVAARWGLTNAAHFSRAFRAAFGLPPVEFRAAAAAP